MGDLKKNIYGKKEQRMEIFCFFIWIQEKKFEFLLNKFFFIDDWL